MGRKRRTRPKSPNPGRGGRSGRITREERAAVLRSIASGSGVRGAAIAVGLGMRAVDTVVADAGGMPPQRTSRCLFHLNPEEREEIFAGIKAKESDRAIGRRIGRAHTTVGREIERNGGRGEYRPFAAERRAEQAAARPKPFKLDVNDALFDYLQQGLTTKWSPQQISCRLKSDHPDDPTMRMSHESIYHALYVQGRGQLRRELHLALRTGRTQRKPRNRVQAAAARQRFPGMVNISERPPEAEDRSVPGHWEGDLIMGSTASNSAIATLVERSTRFVMLIALGRDHTAEHVQRKLIELIHTLPEQLRRSLTWDQGSELAGHAQITLATDMAIYFCDPHSPWQRGSNENTNGLLRQYFPKGSDLSKHSQADLDAVAAELNGRPRQTLDWMTPSEALNKLVH